MDRVRQTIRVALFAATLVAVLDVSYGDSRLPLTCKNIARDAIINSCKGPRSKRSVQEQRPLVRTLTVDGLDSSAEPVTTQQKRQWRTEILPSGMLGPIGPMGSLGPIGPMGAMGPYSMGATDNTYHNVGFSSPTMQYQNDEGSSMTSQMIGPSTSFAPFPGRYRYSLSFEDLEELHEEIGERFVRNSKDLNKKIFLKVAAKCCPNVKLCMDDPSQVPCMGFP